MHCAVNCHSLAIVAVGPFSLAVNYFRNKRCPCDSTAFIIYTVMYELSQSKQNVVRIKCKPKHNHKAQLQSKPARIKGNFRQNKSLFRSDGIWFKQTILETRERVLHLSLPWWLMSGHRYRASDGAPVNADSNRRDTWRLRLSSPSCGYRCVTIDAQLMKRLRRRTR